MLKGTGVGKQYEDSAGLAKMFYTSTALTSLDLADNFLGHLKQTPVGFRQVARGHRRGGVVEHQIVAPLSIGASVHPAV